MSHDPSARCAGTSPRKNEGRKDGNQPSFVTVWKALAMTCQRPSTFSSVR